MTTNTTASLFAESEPTWYDVVATILTIIPVQLIILIIVLGNLLVIVAVCTDHTLTHRRQNWLIASLAIADLLVGVSVMPFSLSYQITGHWYFGPVWCRLWLGLDVLFVTASILNLCVISLDRLLSITYPVRYGRFRTRCLVLVVIGIVWVMALLISLPHLFGLSLDNSASDNSTDTAGVFSKRNVSNIKELETTSSTVHGSNNASWQTSSDKNTCELPRNPSYVLYSACGSFYIPFIILIVVNCRIFVVARRRIAKRRFTSIPHTLVYMGAEGTLRAIDAVQVIQADEDETQRKKTCFRRGRSMKIAQALNARRQSLFAPRRKLTELQYSLDEETACTVQLKIGKSRSSTAQRSISQSSASNISNAQSSSYNATMAAAYKDHSARFRKQEIRTTLVLGVVMLSFMICWLPFFTAYILSAFDIHAPETVFDIFFWFGYLNSAFNPPIYTLVNPEFRKAFRKLVNRLKCWRGRYAPMHRAVRAKSEPVGPEIQLN